MAPRQPRRGPRGWRRSRAVVVGTVVLVAVAIGVAMVLRDDGVELPGITESAAERRPVASGPGATTSVEVKSALDQGIPVMNGSFADPFVLRSGSDVYTYATNVEGANIPVARTVSKTEAEYLGDALPTLPEWTAPGAVWAPSVYERSDGTYVMYYASTYGVTGHQCVGRAVADAPGGPFRDDSDKPLVCPVELGGAIDPSMITVDDQPWLVYKSDGNCCSLPTTIYSVRLSDDLLDVEGSASALISDDQAWEAGVTEAPEMIEVDGTLYLFYSGNDWATASYAIGYAVCQSVTGPCTKPLSEPFHASTSDAEGPGGQTFVTIGDTEVMAFHGWLPGKVDTSGSQRRLYLGAITFDGSSPAFTAYQ